MKGSKLELIMWNGDYTQQISQGSSGALLRSRLQGEVDWSNALAGAGVMRKDTTENSFVFYLFNKNILMAYFFKSYPVLDAFCMPDTVLQHFCVFSHLICTTHL